MAHHPRRGAACGLHNLRTNTDPFCQPFNEDIQVLLRPLFITSWH